MKTIRIGYQGEVGSNSSRAAKYFADKHFDKGENVEFVPLRTSARVFQALYDKKIDYAVAATRNSLAGTVQETMDILRSKSQELVDVKILRIHHSIFKLNENVANDEIRHIASHTQALKQTAIYRSKAFPSADALEIEDTALGAEMLKSGELSPDTAVICPREAGLRNNLVLIQENIEDDVKNRTEFRMFKLPERQYRQRTHVRSLPVSHGAIAEKLVEALIVLLIFVSSWVINRFDLPAWATAASIGGYVLMVYAIVKTSGTWLRNNAFVGYWKYYPVALNSKDPSQQHHVPRLVEIHEERGTFSLKIYTPSFNGALISAVGSKVSVSTLGNNCGRFMYDYSPNKTTKAHEVSGYAFLDWERENLFSKVKTMEGHYFGLASKEVGYFKYCRISKAEFERIKMLEFMEA